MLDFKDGELHDLIPELSSDLLISVDPFFHIEAAMASYMQREEGYHLAKSQVLDVMPSATIFNKNVDGMIGELEVWTNRPQTKWLSPVLLREAGVLLEALGNMKDGACDVAESMQTALLQECVAKLGLLTRKQQTITKGARRQLRLSTSQAEMRPQRC